MMISGLLPLVLCENINSGGCGLSKPLGRIFHGQIATREEIPWIVERPLVFDDFVKPICLPLKKYRIQDKILVVAGWGHMAPDKPSPVLLRTTLKGLDFTTCELTYHIRKYGFEDSKSICAKPESGQFCQGDSGGPMTIKEKDGRSVLLGVIQSGNSCYPANSTSLGTRVSGFMSWIKKEIHQWE